MSDVLLYLVLLADVLGAGLVDGGGDRRKLAEAPRTRLAAGLGPGRTGPRDG